jgi:putrescine transport system ATP-binding protein
MLEIVKLGPSPAQAAPAFRRPAPARGAGARPGQAPKLLLLDEPLGALDKKLREHTQFELINLQEKLGVTFVVVTHDQEEAMTLASPHRRDGPRRDRAGRHADRHLRVPDSRFVADFIGSVNMFEGTLSRTSRTTCASAAELGGTFYVDHGISAAPGATVWARSAPRRSTSRRSPPATPRERVRGSSRRSPTWATCRSTSCGIDSGKTVRMTLPNIRKAAVSAERITWDEEVWLSWHAASPVVLTQ